MSSDTAFGLSIVLFGLVASGAAVLSGIAGDAQMRWCDRTTRDSF